MAARLVGRISGRAGGSTCGEGFWWVSLVVLHDNFEHAIFQSRIILFAVFFVGRAAESHNLVLGKELQLVVTGGSVKDSTFHPIAVGSFRDPNHGPEHPLSGHRKTEMQAVMIIGVKRIRENLRNPVSGKWRYRVRPTYAVDPAARQSGKGALGILLQIGLEILRLGTIFDRFPK